MSDLRDGFLNIVTALDLDGQRPSQLSLPTLYFKRLPNSQSEVKSVLQCELENTQIFHEYNNQII